MLKVATPPTALTVSVPPSVPPAPDWIATVTALVALVTVFPPESSILTTGWVASTAPDAPPTGWVVTASRVADPKPVGEMFPDTTGVRPVAVKPSW